MYEKVNPSHPDKMADRIAGALVDLAYSKKTNPKIAVEVLLGHGYCHIVAETSVSLDAEMVEQVVRRIAGRYMIVDYLEVRQDPILSANQKKGLRCGDNGIFRGVPVTKEQSDLAALAKAAYLQFPHDGKFIIEEKKNEWELVCCQSNVNETAFRLWLNEYAKSRTNGQESVELSAKVNPLGYWTGGPEVDTGATNRKLGSDMGDAVTGGGLHGKDLSKADVSVNIYAHLKAKEMGEPVELFCAIGDEKIDGRPFKDIVTIAREYIETIGGFEKFAEWGLL